MQPIIVCRYALAISCITAGAALAQNFPARSVSVVVPYGPGVGNDVVARIIALRLSENWRHPMVVENRPGAGGAIGTEMVAKAPADGHTLLITSNSQIINAYISKVNYDLVKDFSPVIVPGVLPYLLAVPGASPAKSIKELVALAKASPGKFNFAGSFGSVSHFMGEILKSSNAIDVALITYKSTPDAIADIVSNRVQIWFTTMATGLPLAKGGQVRVLGVSGKKRASVLPEALTMTEAGFPTLDVSATFYILTPAATPRPTTALLNRDIAKALALRDVKDNLAKAGVEAASTTPEETGAMLRDEVASWDKVIKASGVKPE